MTNKKLHRVIAVAMLCCVETLAHADTGGGLGQLQQGLQNTAKQLQQGLAKAGTQLQQGLGAVFGQSGAGLGTSLNKLSGRYVDPTPGTFSFETTVSWQGVKRNVILIRPDPAPTVPTPAIVLLHYDGGTPALMANLTHAGELAAKHGDWVILPAAIGGHWQDDPGVPSVNDDVGFLAAVIADAVTRYGVDADRIAMAGFSNGGFMTQRMGCERPELLSALLSDAASLRNTEAAVCAPSRPLPMALVLGTADPLVPYNGGNGMQSAEQTFAIWGAFNGCDSSHLSSTDLPTVVDDGTHVVLQDLAVCNSGGEVRLYTVEGGGHAWPGGEQYLGTSPLGPTSGNLDTTGLLGDFAALWTRGQTH